jgi:hypothetical protein
LTRRFIIELRISPAVEDKLAARGIQPEDLIAVLYGRPRFFSDKVEGRDKMIGPVNGETYTFVIEPTAEDGIWETVTGWVSSKGEKAKWQQAK